jgi:AAA domain-containing protein
MGKHRQEQVPPMEDGNDGPEGFPIQLLSQSSATRLAHFERCVIEHPFLSEAVLSVQRAVCMPGAEEGYRRLGCMVLVMGPSRVGKTTLIDLLEQELTKSWQERMQRDPGFIPFVRITTDGSGTGRFDWKDYYLSILQQLRDPFLRMKKVSTVARDLREAAEEALLHRKTEIIIVDEAHHLTKARSGRRLQDHLDHLKYFENKTGLSHVLVGTYEMRPFRTVNAQLACRSLDIHFPRYNAALEQERAIFKSILWARPRQLPVERELDLLSEWEWFYARSLGCVGLLKQQLNQALGLALAEEAKTVTLAHLRKTALHKEKADVALEAILEGEKDFMETEDADLELLVKLGLRQTPSRERRTEVLIPTVGARRPGERTPGRDPVGSLQQEQEGGTHEDQCVAG